MTAEKYQNLKDASQASQSTPEADQMKTSRLHKSANTILAIDKQRTPLESIKNLGVPVLPDTPEDRKTIREICRGYASVHHLVPTCIDIYSRFPVQGYELVCKDDELTEFYEELFFDSNGLDYDSFLVEMGKEYWTVGEVTTLGSFNEVLGVWEGEEILNPDDITIRQSPFEEEPSVYVSVPDYLKELVNNTSSGGFQSDKFKKQRAWESKVLRTEYPDIVEAVLRDEPLEVSPVLISRIVNKSAAWDVYGTPHLMRAIRPLIMEESLNAAQDAIADRLYAPFILAKLGLVDAGDGQPWVPSQEQLAAFRDDIQDALSADFRLMAHHFGVDIRSVFGRESLPNFDRDYERIERKLLQVWGIGEALISGSSQGAYASSALNRELVTQLMSTYQKWIVRHYRRRAEVVAEAQEHFDYELSGGVRVPKYEEVYEVDPETGKGYVRKRPKLLIPDLRFKTLNLRDEAQERKFLEELRRGGVPISDRTLAVNIPIDFEDEVDQIEEEKIAKVVAEQSYKVNAYKILKTQGLPIPHELKEVEDFLESRETPTPEEGEERAAETEQEAEDAASSDQASPDITSPAPTPNISPTDDAGGGGGGTPSETTPSGGTTEETGELPRNEIRNRPEVSDEMRPGSPRMTRFDPNYTSVRGLRNLLSEESVRAAVSKRDPRVSQGETN